MHTSAHFPGVAKYKIGANLTIIEKHDVVSTPAYRINRYSWLHGCVFVTALTRQAGTYRSGSCLHTLSTWMSTHSRSWRPNVIVVAPTFQHFNISTHTAVLQYSSIPVSQYLSITPVEYCFCFSDEETRHCRRRWRRWQESARWSTTSDSKLVRNKHQEGWLCWRIFVRLATHGHALGSFWFSRIRLVPISDNGWGRCWSRPW